MSAFFVKLKNDASWYSIQDNVTINDWNAVDLNVAIQYDHHNTARDQWFFIENFHQHAAFLPMLGQNVDTADVDPLSLRDFGNMDFLAYSHSNKFYLQKVVKGSFVNRQIFSFSGNSAEVKELDNTIYINPTPNCIYDKTEHRLYFMDIAKAYGIFGPIRTDYRTATDADIQTFINAGIVDAAGLDISKVSLLNRKKLSSVLHEFRALQPDEQDTVKNYVESMTNGHLQRDPVTGLFLTPDDNALRAVLYGLQMRFYKTPLSQESQVATSSTRMSYLFPAPPPPNQGNNANQANNNNAQP